MSQSSRLSDKTKQTTQGSGAKSNSALIVLFVTALDTTWRVFVPSLGGVFLGIGLDAWWHTAPIATIAGLILGTILGTVLIIRQLTNVRKPL
jgi:F0F1-type ATP synthase assembly protein I